MTSNPELGRFGVKFTINALRADVIVSEWIVGHSEADQKRDYGSQSSHGRRPRSFAASSKELQSCPGMARIQSFDSRIV